MPVREAKTSVSFCEGGHTTRWREGRNMLHTARIIPFTLHASTTL